ncbi:hypothetical protein Pint_06761 [Pistacia integerrima]|uniref:Uncharacterized protein n=1 Tax=Pistacia integerrima TaxID=434235 RepID=A0ACC0XW21_9ROSI|nr:hypothetical protein Pint_06761 [Pistacia integerrima]
MLSLYLNLQTMHRSRRWKLKR